MTDRYTSKNPACETTMEEILVLLFESALQADYDFSGEQREWHLPRLQRVMKDLMVMFPADAAAALQKARTPYGDLVVMEKGGHSQE